MPVAAVPLRILHVHTFYGEYLRNFYTRHRFPVGTPFPALSRALFRDGFSAIHLPDMYLTDCTAMLVIANDPASQGAWAKEHNLTMGEDWQTAILAAQIEHFHPDVLYMPDCIRYDGRFVRSLPFRPPLVMGWRAADVPCTTDWHGFDIILSGLPRMLPLAKTLGAGDGVLFYPGMPAWISRDAIQVAKDTDVVFAGGISPSQHAERQMLLDILAKAATQYNFSLALHLSCDRRFITPAMEPYIKPAVFGLDMHRALARGRIVFDCQGQIGLLRPDGTRQLDLAAGDTANMRLFEATGGGSLLLTQAMPGLARLFEPGKEVATFTSPDDLVKKTLYYLKHEDERQAVAERGHARCLDEWGMKKRSAAFRRIIDSALARKE